MNPKGFFFGPPPKEEESKFGDFLRFGILKARYFFADGEIDDKMARDFRYQTAAMLGENCDPVTVVINSPGGSVIAGFDMVSQIRLLQRQGIEVRGVVQGDAASMAAVLLAAADHRSMSSLSRIMWHGIQGGSRSADMDDLDNQRAEIERMASKLAAILTNRVRPESQYADPDFVRKLMRDKRPHWITPEAALAAGIVDEVID